VQLWPDESGLAQETRSYTTKLESHLNALKQVQLFETEIQGERTIYRLLKGNLLATIAELETGTGAIEVEE